MTDASRGAADEIILDVRDVRVVFGGIVALDGVTFAMRRGEILGLIGPNGAGKTTLFNCLSRLYVPTSGDIRLDGISILDRPAHRIAERGIGRTFQNVALFPRLSVLDNVLVGTHCRTRSDMVADALRLPWINRQERASRARVAEILDELGLADLADLPVGGLPFGTQKRVELARALAASPTLLLLDEPAGGLNHDEVFALGDLIRGLRARHGLSVLLVEHHMGLVMSLADHVVALNFGRKLAEGAPAAIQRDPEVIRAYLGSEAA